MSFARLFLIISLTLTLSACVKPALKLSQQETYDEIARFAAKDLHCPAEELKTGLVLNTPIFVSAGCGRSGFYQPQLLRKMNKVYIGSVRKVDPSQKQQKVPLELLD